MQSMNLKIKLRDDQLVKLFGRQQVAAVKRGPDINWFNSWGANIHPITDAPQYGNGTGQWYIVCGHHCGEAKETVQNIIKLLHS